MTYLRGLRGASSFGNGFVVGVFTSILADDFGIFISALLCVAIFVTAGSGLLRVDFIQATFKFLIVVHAYL
jgi:hypothetical protein